MHLKQFSQVLIDWQKTNGRHDLPWQIAEPYARWISEIMLQQTQVITVTEYFNRFMKRFPTVESLARASEDEVMQYWSGLGYYSRARNLHLSAQIIVRDLKSKFPTSRKEWEALPGVGRSTAAAIVAFSFGAKETILDGNVKRVLMRLFCLDAPSDDKKTVDKLWVMAEELLPEREVDIYIQGLMDLGATVCTRTPKCILCPYKEHCLALKEGLQNEIPRPKKRHKRSQEERTFLLIWDENECFLKKRTEKGVWKGLFSLIEFEGHLDEDRVLIQVEQMGFKVKNVRFLESFSHDFSHYRLVLHPVAVKVKKEETKKEQGRWVKLGDLPDIGIPAPIRSLLDHFFV